MPDMATAEDLATFLRETVDTGPAEQAIELAEGAVRGWTKQTITRVADDVVQLDPPQGSRLFLPQRPADKPTAVRILGQTTQIWQPLAATQWIWYPQRGFLTPSYASPAINWSAYAEGTGWGELANVVEVTYSHGYEAVDIPPDIKRVVLQAAARFYTNPVALSSERALDYSFTAPDASGLTAQERIDLKRYMRAPLSARLVTVT